MYFDEKENKEENDAEYSTEENEDIAFEDDSFDAGDAAASVKKLKEKLKNCQKERQEYLDGWQRAKADLLNQRKRLEDEQSRTALRAKAKILTDLLSLSDSFDMAFKDADAWKTLDQSWTKGIEGIHAQLGRILKEYNVTEVTALGQPFDPNVHDAVSEAPVEDEKQDHTVVEVLQKGYKMEDTLLRPARVIIGTFKK